MDCSPREAARPSYEVRGLRRPDEVCELWAKEETLTI